METHLADFIRDTPSGREAEAILRACVHCGFCTATCPTYQLFGDELDGPRGRIYLIKQVLEGAAPGEKTRLHLDRCLTCRACETTCPSGVHYSRLLDIGRGVVDAKLPRHGTDALTRGVLKELLPRSGLFGTALKLGQQLRPLLPSALRAKVPALPHPQPLSTLWRGERSVPFSRAAGEGLGMRAAIGPWPMAAARRRMLTLAGCVQPAMLPNINVATARVLARLGIGLAEIAGAGCCGAVRFHLGDVEGAKQEARRNIDAWWPQIEGGAEAIVITASGCGVQVKDYGHLLREDARYAAKAERIAGLAKDVAEVVAAEAELLRPLLAPPPAGEPIRVAFHAPCTLQHGLKIRGVVEPLLAAAGFHLLPVADSHLCCGSAGTYSVLQADIANRLRGDKLAALSAGQPQFIASANVGCIAHLQGGSGIAVCHWIELIDERLHSANPGQP